MTDRDPKNGRELACLSITTAGAEQAIHLQNAHGTVTIYTTEPSLRGKVRVGGVYEVELREVEAREEPCP